MLALGRCMRGRTLRSAAAARNLGIGADYLSPGARHPLLAPPIVPPPALFQTRPMSGAVDGGKRFDQLAICEPLQDAITKVLKYEVMSECQQVSIPKSLSGHDMLTKAKTGTGKTLAFLIPVIHQLMEVTSTLGRQGQTSILIISPARELAGQIAQEAKQLTKFLPLTVQAVYGGTKSDADVRKFNNNGYPDILVATPGRLNDLLKNSDLRGALSGLKFMVRHVPPRCERVCEVCVAGCA
jgi:hypothetical protein